MQIDQQYQDPPTNFPTKNHSTHGCSSRPSLPQVVAYIVIALTICVYFFCIHIVNQNFVFLSLFCVFMLVMIISSTVATFTNPTDRIIYYYKWSKNDNSIKFKPDYQKVVFCDLCDSYCQRESKHCRSCNRCTENFDHHCMWLNNCVGKRNYKEFFISIVATFGFIAVFEVHAIIMSVSVDYHVNFPIGRVASVWIMMVVLSVFEFLLFNLILLHLYLNWTNQTTYCFLQRRKKEELEELQKKTNEQSLRKQSGESATKFTSEENTNSVANTHLVQVISKVPPQKKDTKKIDEIFQKQSEMSVQLDINRTMTKTTNNITSHSHENQIQFNEKNRKESSKIEQIQGTNQMIFSQQKNEDKAKLPQFLKNNRTLKFILRENQAESPTKNKIYPS